MVTVINAYLKAITDSLHSTTQKKRPETIDGLPVQKRVNLVNREIAARQANQSEAF